MTTAVALVVPSAAPVPGTLAMPTVLAMTSREIAELTGKLHQDVLRDVRIMLEQLEMGASSFAASYLSEQNKPLPMFSLPKDLTTTGQLNEAGRKAITLFQEMDAVNPDAAKLTAGDAAYKRFSDIGFLMHLGRDVSDAASIATTSGLGALAGTPADKLEKQVRAEVEKLGDTPWMDWLSNTAHDTGDFLARNNPVTLTAEFAYGVGRAVTGFDEPGPVSDNRPAWLKSARQSSAMHSTTPNTAQVHSWVKRYATLLAHSGQVGDAETALKLAVAYISSPKVSAKVNGTLYLRSELPAPPQGGTSEEWLGKFIDAVPKARAKELEFSGDQVRLEYDERSRIYRAFVAGLPLEDAEGNLMVFPKGSIERWYATQHQVEVNAAAARGAVKQSGNTHKAYEARLMGEIGALQKTDRFVMERYGNSTYGASDLSSRITSRAAYCRVTKKLSGKAV